MTELITENLYLIILLPLWIFIIIMAGRFFSVYINKKLIYILTLLSSSMGAVISVLLYSNFPSDRIYECVYPFVKINDFVIPFGIHVDKLSLIFSSVLFVISFLIQIFSISYTKYETKQYRFFALLNLFNFSLAGLFFSPNLYQTYVLWEIAGIISYLLISFDYDNSEKSLASKKVFIINRIGDTAFLGGIIICSYLLYEYAPAKSLASLSFYDINTSSVLVDAYASTPLFLTICGLFLIAAAVKSAQFPFYTWLQDAMAAKLPVSALLHSSTLVALGVYLIIRLLPFYTMEPIILKFVVHLGILTAIICSMCAIAQTNAKKTLAYSTSAQLGLMFYAIGVLNIKAGLALFCAHAAIKSLLFITLPDEDKEWNYAKFFLFLIGGLSLSGALLSGMIAKELFTYSLGLNGKIIISILSFLSAFYIMRIALVIVNKQGLEKIKPINFEIFPALGLLAANIVLYIYIRKIGTYQIAESFWAAITAWAVVYIMYLRQLFFKVPYIYPLCYNGFYLDKFYMTTVLYIYNTTANIFNKIDIKFLSNYNPIINISKFGIAIVSWIETNIMNKSVSSTANFTRRISAISKQFQTKNVQWYNFYGFVIITAIISVLVIAYVAILTYSRGVG